MKVLRILSLVLILLTVAGSVQAQDPTQLRGWGFGAGAHDGDFGLQVRKDFWLGGDISQFSGQAGVYFHHRTTLRLDADYHFIINPGSPSRFYPLVGLQFAFNSDRAKFGLNLGGGFNFMLTETLAGFAELKYVVSDWDGLAFMIGIYF